MEQNNTRKKGYFYSWKFVVSTRENSHTITVFAADEERAKSRIRALWKRALSHLENQKEYKSRDDTRTNTNKNINPFVHFLRGEYCEPLPEVLTADIEAVLQKPPFRYKHSNSVIISSSKRM